MSTDLETVTTMLQAAISRRKSGPTWLTNAERDVLILHLDGYVLTGSDRHALRRLLLKLKASASRC